MAVYPPHIKTLKIVNQNGLTRLIDAQAVVSVFETEKASGYLIALPDSDYYHHSSGDLKSEIEFIISAWADYHAHSTSVTPISDREPL